MLYRLKGAFRYLIIFTLVFIAFLALRNDFISRRNKINANSVFNQELEAIRRPLLGEAKILNISKVSKGNDIVKIKKKYIVFECKSLCGGWADRLKGIMSSYALAQLTNRQLIIDIAKPCNFLELLEPNQVNWNIRAHQLAATRSNIWCIDNQQCAKRFDNADPSNFEPENDIIVIQLNNDWLAHLSQSKNFEKPIRDLGYTPENFKLIYRMHEWYNKLFKLTPVLQAQYDAFWKDSKLTPNTTLVCAQIRIGGPREHVQKGQDDPRNDLNTTYVWWKFIRENYLADLSDKEWKLYVTADHKQAENDAIEAFGAERVLRIPGLNTHVDVENNLPECTRVHKPMLDFHFMQHCDKLAVSWSGFGKLGAWNRDDPIKDLNVYLEGKWHKASYNMTIL